jgi:hypothetical protein
MVFDLILKDDIQQTIIKVLWGSFKRLCIQLFNPKVEESIMDKISNLADVNIIKAMFAK